MRPIDTLVKSDFVTDLDMRSPILKHSFHKQMGHEPRLVGG